MLFYQPTFLLTLLFYSSLCLGGNILVFPMDGSHWLNLKILIEELHSRDHFITVLRPADSWYIAESPLFKTIHVKPMSSSEKKLTSLMAKVINNRLQPSLLSSINTFFDITSYINQKHKSVVEAVGEIFENKTLMQELTQSKYDFMLTDPVLGAGVLLAHRLGLPLVLMARWTVAGEAHSLIAPSPLSYVPAPTSERKDRMTFVERVKNTLRCLLLPCLRWYTMDSHYKPFVHHYFGSDVHYLELFQAADLWLMRVDFTFEFPRPTMPNAVYIGGFQCKPPKPLPQELEEFVHSSGEHGVIVMSLGTIVSQLPEHVVEEIAAAFAKLPQKVIWRHKGRKPDNLRNNTLLLDWLPQNDLLGHPKTKLFVSHGGTNGIQEAIYHGVPLVGIPLAIDQPDNFVRMESRGVAKVLNIWALNRDTFLHTLKEVLYESSYREKMRALSTVHRDTPLKPLDTAMFWIEFVIRHRGTKHLRTESYKLSLTQFYCIDVVLFLAAVTLFGVVTIITGLKVVGRVYNGRKLKKQ